MINFEPSGTHQEPLNLYLISPSHQLWELYVHELTVPSLLSLTCSHDANIVRVTNCSR